MSVKPVLAVAALLVCAAAAQAPHIGVINYYGLHHLTQDRISKALEIQPGGALPPSKADMEDALSNLPGVVAESIEAVCCDGASTDLFIGVEEQGAPHPSFRTPPSGSTSLPQGILDTYREFLSAVQHAAVKGTAEEDMTSGQPLMSDPAVRALQDQFMHFADNNLDVLRQELRTGSVPEERAVAALVIGYAPTKKEIVDDLQYAINDYDPAVRANAMKSLNAIATMAHQQPGFGIHIQPTWFVEMLNSVVLSDRVESMRALLTLTDGGTNPGVLDLVRERALGSVIEMARWKTLRYALPPFILAGRLAGMKDAQIHEAWEKGDRESVIQKAQNAVESRRR